MSHVPGAPPMCAGPQREVRAPREKLPAGAVDCHAHVFGHPEQYPYAATRAYTPPPVFLDDYLAMHDAAGIARGVLVHSGVHGTDNGAMLDALRRHPQRLRGVALIAEDVGEAELEMLDRAGVRGFRVNLAAGTGVQMVASRWLAERVAWRGWHVQFLLDVEEFPDLDQVLGAFPTEVVIDHMGRPDPKRGVAALGFQALIRLLRSGRGWSKLSAPYRTSGEHPPYADMIPFARALAEAAPDRLVWGSDWPHVMLETPMPNDGDLVGMLADWVPDAAARKRIWVDNPQRLYGFPPA